MPYRTHKESDEAIILLKRKILHSDTVIVVLSHHFGKIALLAKGVQKITSKRIAALQTGNIVKISFSQKNNQLRYLSSVELISHLSHIKTDIKKMNNLYILLFMFERLIPEGQIDEQLYTLCKNSIVSIAKMDVDAFSVTNAMSSILSALGYGECHTYEECASKTEEILGKKLPLTII